MDRREVRDVTVTLDDVARSVVEYGFLDVSFDVLSAYTRIPVRQLMVPCDSLLQVLERAMDLAVEDWNWPVYYPGLEEFLEKNAMTLYDKVASHMGLGRLVVNGVVGKSVAEKIFRCAVMLQSMGLTDEQVIVAMEAVLLLIMNIRADIEGAASKTGNLAEVSGPYADQAFDEDTVPFVAGLSILLGKVDLTEFEDGRLSLDKMVALAESFEDVLHVPAREWANKKVRIQIAGLRAAFTE